MVSDKYHDEGTLFWTFFTYIDNCFVLNGPKVKSLDECFDWSTVMINGNEEVKTINSCVNESFLEKTDFESEN